MDLALRGGASLWGIELLENAGRSVQSRYAARLRCLGTGKRCSQLSVSLMHRSQSNDLTGRNPNVLYELGLAHAIAKPAVIITSSLDDVPFDLRGLRIITYDKMEPTWGDILKNKITQSIAEVLAAPLESIPSIFLKAEIGPEPPPVSEMEMKIIRIGQDLESLRREVRRPEAVQRRSTPIYEEIEREVYYGLQRGLSYDEIFEMIKKSLPPNDKELLGKFIKAFEFAKERTSAGSLGGG